MKYLKYAFALLAVLALVTAANATTVWNFGTTTSTESNGFTVTPVAGESISAYAFQTTAGGTLLSTPTNNGFGTPTLSGLFEVDVNGEGDGIGPYNPTETQSNFQNQDGITDTVSNVGGSFHNGPYNNFLELQLSANIPAGTVLTFVLSHGNGDGSAPASVNVYTDNNATVGSGISYTGMTLADSNVNVNTIGQPNPGGSFTITATGKNEVVAIVADCHYLLLDSITGTSSVPEPRFYGLLLAGLLGLVGIFVHNRKRVTE